MRLLTEAAGQVLTRNVAANRCWVLVRSIESCERRRGASAKSMSMPVAMFPPKISLKVLGLAPVALR